MTELKQELCRICHLLYERGYVVSHDGNVSVRTEKGILVTPSGVNKGRMEPEMMVLCDPDGNVLEGDRYPSSETAMHLQVYRDRPDVNAVVHAHPSVSTAFAACRRGLTEAYLIESVSGLGPVPAAPYALPSTKEVPESIRPYLPDHNAVLLSNHGALAWGKDLWEAFDRMEMVEHTAKIYAHIHQLGGGAELTKEQVNDLLALSGHYEKLAGKRT